MTDGRLVCVTDGGVVIAELSGEIDIANTDGLLGQLGEAMEADVDALIADLSEVRYVDSAGIRMLFGLAGHLKQCRQIMMLVVPDASPLRRLFAIARIEEVVQIVATRGAAIASVGRPDPDRLHGAGDAEDVPS